MVFFTSTVQVFMVESVEEKSLLISPGKERELFKLVVNL